MSRRFIELTNFDKFEQFVAEINRARRPLSYAYCEAFQAFEKSREVLRESEAAADFYGGAGNDEEATLLQNEAYSYDVQADMFASVAILFADDLLRRFHQQLFGTPLLLTPGYGKEHNNQIRLTTLWQAGGNAIRHASSWADLPFPYPSVDDESLDKYERQALTNIQIIESAFGSLHAPTIRAPSWSILHFMNYADGETAENYDNYEVAIIDAALAMTKAHSSEATSQLEAQLNAS
jgi:hypothetical protein